MLVLNNVLIVGWISLMVLFITQLKRLKIEVSYLPKRVSNLMKTHPLEGKLLTSFGIRGFTNPAIVYVATPKCSSCDVKLQLYLNEFLKKEFPVICWLEKGEDFQSVSDFIDKYKSSILINTIDSKIINQLSLKIFPCFLVVDRLSKVVKVSLTFEEAKEVYKKLL